MFYLHKYKTTKRHNIANKANINYKNNQQRNKNVKWTAFDSRDFC